LGYHLHQRKRPLHMLQLKVARLVLRVYTDKCTCSCDYDSRTKGGYKK
jgi:hypothetical protein